MALLFAKSRGKNAFVVFEQSMLAEVEERQNLELDLWRAFDRNQFEVWYQPQVDLRNGDLIGVEALLRWRHPERGLVSPAEFIPIAEAIGLIEPLGKWVLETACMEVANWRSPTKLAVNVSSAQFERGDMVACVSRALEHSALPPSQLDLEITESLFMQPSELIRDTLAQLRAFGVGIALDDFGTGFSSLSYIHKFPIDKIKIDRSFVAGLPTNQDSAAIVQAVSVLAHSLNLCLIAEGIETTEQASFLRLMGVTEGQGYVYGRPQPSADIAKLLTPPPGQSNTIPCLAQAASNS